MARKIRTSPLSETGNAVFDSQLDVLRPLFSKQGVQEIVAVRPREVRLELDGGRWETVNIPDLTLERWEKVLSLLATRQGQHFGPDQPRVSARLPGGHRLDAMVGRAVGEGISVAIRVHRQAKRSYEDFGCPPALIERLRAAAVNGDNVVLSGGTSSGKTSLVNAYIRDVPLHERVLFAEEVSELQVPHENKAGFLLDRNNKEATVSYADVFDHAMRARPDRLWLGELSIPNAYPALLFLNNGHKGFLTSAHANNCTAALETGFWFRLSMAGYTMDRSAVFEFLKRNIDLVVHVERLSGGRRRAVEFWEPSSGAQPVRLVGEGEWLNIGA